MAKFITDKNNILVISEFQDAHIHRMEPDSDLVVISTGDDREWITDSRGKRLFVKDIPKIMEIAEKYENETISWDELINIYIGEGNSRKW